MKKIKLYRHQQILIDENKKKGLLPWETGTGKTIGLVYLLKKNNPLGESSLIICIKSDKDKWLKVVKDFFLNADVMTKEEFRKATTGQKEIPVFKNGEKILYKKKYPKPNNLKEYNYLVIDEAHFFIGLTSMMYKSLTAYLKLYNPEYLWLATATPYPNNPWNLYCLFNLLGMERNYISFRQHFFFFKGKYPRGFWEKKTIINGRPIEDEIAKWINFLGKAVELEKCVDMPEKILIEEYFELTAEQKRAYKSIDEKLIMTRNQKWHQICGGAVRLMDKFTGQVKNLFFKSNKLNRLVELCQEHKKIFIVCKYQNEVDLIEKTLKEKIKDRTILTFTGKNSQNRPSQANSTNLLQECIVIANAACSSAYECPTIHLMIFYSYDFSLVNYIQIIGRIRRMNKPAPKTYLSLIIKDTIDEAVFEAIQNKKKFDIKIYNKDK